MGLKEIPPAVVKGIINRNIKWWLNQSIFMVNDILNVGYAYQNLTMTEHYNATGSPYWVCKAFVILLLPIESGFWEEDEEPMPLLNLLHWIKSPEFIIARNAGSPILFPANHQASREWEHATAKYEKFAYSTKFGFNVSRGNSTIEGKALDSTIAISFDGKLLIEKHRSEDAILENGVIKSIWKPNEEISIQSYIIPGNPWHIRAFEILINTYVRFYDFGFSINAENFKIEEEPNEIRLLGTKSNQVSAIRNLYGNGVLKYYVAEPNTNLLYPKNAVPYSSWYLKKGIYFLADAVYGGAALPASIPMIKKMDSKIVVENENVATEFLLSSISSEPHNRLLRMKRYLQALKQKLK